MKNKLAGIILVFLSLAQISLGAVIIDNPSLETININVSQTSVNRLVLPSKIIDIAYSKEKGIDIQLNENQAFIKYVPTKKENIRSVGNQTEIIGDPEILYDNAKGAEVFFVTANGTFSFALNPKNIEAQTIIVNDFSVDKKEVLKYERENDYVATLSKITESILKGGTPQGYKLKERPKLLKDLRDIKISYLNTYEGVLYSAHLLEVKNKTKEAIILNPKEFIAIADGSPKSISIYYDNEINHLLPLGSAKVVIITKAKKWERSYKGSLIGLLAMTMEI